MPLRMAHERKGDLLLECARLHYLEKLNKTEIAARLQISGTHVARLLREAEEAGIVEISVRLPADHDKLAAELQERFGLQAVKIVDFSDDYEQLLKNLGRGGAALFEEICQIRWGARVGFGGGITLHEVVDALDTKPRQIELYPLALVGRGSELEHVDSVFLVTALYFKSRPAAKAFVVGVPPLPQSRVKAQQFTADLLTEVDEVREVYQAARDVEVAFVGLGTLPPDRGMLKEFGKVGLDLKTLKAKGAIGMMNYNYFDHRGVQIGEYFLTVSVQDIQAMSRTAEKKVVLVAGGLHKFEAIHVALAHRMFNMLVTDHRTAQKLAALPSPLKPWPQGRRNGMVSAAQ
ncbi:MAG TPA: sugar-binding domain-containing protein [Candidatus Tectomicrobia bacterium]|jgi:deoxyribonucleoside regulator|nr:sugar-binding domain-containing protein [Candidatus Tectomicrobia bacterium]